MKCPKCRGLLIQEDIREHSGRFQGWRCVQCGFRLDHRIAQNRTSAPPEPTDDDAVEAPVRVRTAPRPAPLTRGKRAASKA